MPGPTPSHLPKSDYAALLPQGSRGLLSAVARQENLAARLELRATGESHLAQAAESEAAQAAHLAAARGYMASAAAARAMARFNRCVLGRIEAPRVQLEAA